MSENIETILIERDIHPTSMRILILKSMLGFSHAFSLMDLEAKLETVDKSTISRTINLFREKLLIHSIDDGSGSIKYAVCHHHCDCEISDLHVHFYCFHCHKTFCLEEVSIPQIKIPSGLIPKNINFVIKGFCDDCASYAT